MKGYENHGGTCFVRDTWLLCEPFTEVLKNKVQLSESEDLVGLLSAL